MNQIILMGRFTKDPEIVYQDNGVCRASFSLAVDRVKKDDGTDFFRCVAFSKTAEFIEKYFSKGMKALIVGRMRQDSYTNQSGVTIPTSSVFVNTIEFCESKSSQSSMPPVPDKDSGDGFMNIPDGIDEELPFN